MEVWRRLPYDVGPPQRHVRLSDALVRHGRIPTIWWHSTDERALLLGAGQEVPGVRNTAAVRRQAGGTAVLVGPGVLGLDVMLPAGHRLAPPDIVETYGWLGEAWAAALRTLAVDAHLVTIAEARAAARDPLTTAACFGSLSPYEVTVAGRKLVGLAQVRRGNGTLLQAGIHQRFDADGLASALSPYDADAVASRLRAAAVGLDEIRKVPAELLMDAFHSTLQTSLDIAFRDADWDPAEQIGG